MASFDLATGYVTFKGDLSKLEADIMKGQRMVKELDKALDTPAGQMKFKMALDAAKRINQELEKGKNFARNYMMGGNTQAQQNRQERDERWLAKQEAREARQSQRQAILAENRQERDEKWLARKEAMEIRAAERLKVRAQERQNRDENWLAKKEAREEKTAEKAEAKAKRQAGGAFMTMGAAGAAAGAGALGLASAASPLASSTLEGSFKLFSATVGQTFIPLVIDMSKTLQDASNYWDNLNSGLKGTIATTTKMAAVAGVATLALAGVGKALTFISKNPLVMLGGLALSAVLGSTVGAGDNKGERDPNDPGPGGAWERDRRRFGRKWFEADNRQVNGKWQDAKGNPIDALNVQGVGQKAKLGSSGPASFVQASELLRSIMQVGAGTGELEQLRLQKEMAGNLEIIAQNTRPKEGKVAP